MPTAYLSDLDHTLLDGSAQLSPLTRRALLRLLADGVAFSVASARSAASIRSMFDGVPLTLPVIEFGGAHISDPVTGAHLVTHALAPGVADAVVRIGVERGLAPFISSFDGTADHLSHQPPKNDGQRWYVADRVRVRDPRLRQVNDLRAAADEEVVCITFIALPFELDALEAELAAVPATGSRRRRFENGYSPGWDWLTVQSERACKGEAARDWRRLTGLDGHELVVFGDGDNDLELFDVADRGIAVANATPGVRARATRVIGHHLDDAVARYLLEEHGLTVEATA